MLADLKPGDQMDLDVMVNSYEIKFSERVKNNYFLAMTCKDSSGEIPVKVFDLGKDKLDELVSLLDENKFIHVLGNVEEFKGSINAKATEIEFIDEPEDLSYYERCSGIPISDLKSRLNQAISSRGPSNLTLSSSVGPLINSVAIQGSSPIKSESRIFPIAGSESLERTSASVAKRFRASSSSTNSCLITLIAAFCAPFSARKTVPKPPSPSRPLMRHPPNSSGSLAFLGSTAHLLGLNYEGRRALFIVNYESMKGLNQF
jgi:hypothetical protein